MGPVNSDTFFKWTLVRTSADDDKDKRISINELFQFFRYSVSGHFLLWFKSEQQIIRKFINNAVVILKEQN